jgi:hypothetical protein
MPASVKKAILAGHLQATQSRFAATNTPLLVLHDTTEFTFARKNPAAIGIVHLSRRGRPPKDGRKRPQPVCGILLHSSLAVTTEGLAAGLGRDQVLELKRVQGHECLKTKDQSDARAR